MKIIFSVMFVAMLFGLGSLWHFSHDEKLSCNYFIYQSHDVSYTNPATGLTLSGTLTLPNCHRPTPALILVAGTGKHDRDCTSNGHKLFYAISDYLSHQGIAVLRYDKRGVGQSQGVFDTTLTTADFASDAQAAFAYLQSRSDIDSSKIGLLGHSEGGLIVSMIASQCPQVAYVISMAGAASTKIEDIVGQAALQVRADGGSQEIIDLDALIRTKILTIVDQEKDTQVAAKKIRQAVDEHFAHLTPEQNLQAEALAFESGHEGGTPQAPVYCISRLNSEFMMHIYNSQWVRFLIAYDSVAMFKKIKQPFLAVNGSLDFIVAAQVALPIFALSLLQGGNQDVSLIEMPSVNHWLQPCSKGSLDEYGKTDVVIAPAFLDLIGNWIAHRIS